MSTLLSGRVAKNGRCGLSDNINELAEVLCTCWQKYSEVFGEVPHGTQRQLKALLALGANDWLDRKLLEARIEEAELTPHDDLSHITGMENTHCRKCARVADLEEQHAALGK